MNCKLNYCIMLIVAMFLGSFIDPLPPEPMEVDEVQYFTFQQKSTRSWSVTPRPSMTGLTTNGEIIVGAAAYSDDDGATWNSFASGPTPEAESIHIDGNNVYALYETATDVFEVWTTDVSVNHTLTQLGADLDLSAVANSDWHIWTINSNTDGKYIVLLREDTSGASGDLYVFKYDSGAGNWSNGADTHGSVDKYVGMFASTADLLPVFKNSYYNSADQEFYFCGFQDNSVVAVREIRVFRFDTNADQLPFNGGNEDFYISDYLDFYLDYDANNYSYVSKDFWVQVSNDVYLISGEQWNGAGTSKLNDAVIKIPDLNASYDGNPGGDASAWTEVSQKRIVPIAGTSPRLWGFIQDSDEIFRSLDDGDSFILIEDEGGGRTWEGGIEYSDSDLGFGAFDGNAFYTQQDNLEASFADVVAKQKDQDNGWAIIKGDFTWPTNKILELFDNNSTPALIFRGRQAGTVQGTGANRKYDFNGIEKTLMEAETISFSYTTATGVHTIARDAVDQAGLKWTSASIPDPSVTHIMTADKDQLPNILDELADLIDGDWYIDPNQVVYLLKVTSLNSSGITKTEADTTTVRAPLFEEIQKTFNYIHAYGKGYIESDGDSKDDNSITENGKIELVRYEPNCTDLTKLKAIAASLLVRDGIATPPIKIRVQFKTLNYTQPGETINYRWNFYDELDTATDYIISSVIYLKNGSGWVEFTNSLFQEGREYKESVTRKPYENEQQIRNLNTDFNKWHNIGSANAEHHPCDYTGSRNGEASSGALVIDSQIKGTTSTNPIIHFSFPKPTNRGGLKLYVTEIKFNITSDGGVNNWVDDVVIMGMDSTGENAQETDTTNHSGVGEKTFIFASAYDMSAYSYVAVKMTLITDNTTPDIAVTIPTIKFYYDT